MASLTDRAREILRRNDRGGYTVPTDGLYPYQWNWDSCLVALGWATFDEDRAWQEIETLFAAQWDDGMVPHIVFHVPDEGYFPGAEVYDTGRSPPSSGLTQPPVAASVVRRLLERARDRGLAATRARALLPKLLSWHRWFHTARDPDGLGLVAIYHPWESGMDNSPAWDTAMANVPIADLPPYTRRDTTHVDPSHRPTKQDYDRYLTLIKVMRENRYEPAALYREVPFRVADPSMNGILLRADRDLAWVAENLGEADACAEIEPWIVRGEAGFQRLWNPDRGMFVAYDLVADAQVPATTSAGFLGLYGGAATADQVETMTARMDRWLADAPYGLPTVAVDDPLFDGRRYWRGPAWAIFSYMIAEGLSDYGHRGRAAQLAARTAKAIGETGFYEAFDPVTGAGSGGADFTWTAAMWLSWLDGPAAAGRPAIRKDAAALYGEARADAVTAGLNAIIADFARRHPQSGGERTIPQEAVLITYGDQIGDANRSPAAAQRDWLATRLDGIVGTVHVLPFYPYSSDDGFSVIDYRAVDPEVGDWSDIAGYGGHFTLMFDAVVNHISAESAWFRAFRDGLPPYRDYFPAFDPEAVPDLSGVTRPRTSPLLHRFETPSGPRSVWTTFSADQVDLDYANPDVLFEIVDLLLFYVSRGARLIRLDAVSYLWKQPGTTCINLPETHACIRLMRAVLDAVAPEVLLVTETNVPHAENIAYFGDGQDEAQMVYQFALPPLLLDAVWRGDARRLRGWAAGLSTPSEQTAFFNITATHDGIGLRPVADLMPAEDVDWLVEQARARGAEVSAWALPDGGESPYELNITMFDALLAPGDDPAAPLSLDRYVTAQAVALTLAGIPAVYFHNLVGTRNDQDGFARTERARSLNRRRYSVAELDALLDDGSSREHAIFERYSQLLSIWRKQPAFHPASPQKMLEAPDGVLAVRRGGEDRGCVVALHNLSAAAQSVSLRASDLPGPVPGSLSDLIGGRESRSDGGSFAVELEPYEMLWLGAPAAH